MAVAVDPFDSWLAKKLESLEIDEGVFGSYIKGILEGDESEEEKINGIESILTGVTENEISNHVSEIINFWNNSVAKIDKVEVSAPEDVDDRLIKMLESQNLQTLTQKSYTAEERQIRDAILAQYGQTSVDNESDEDCGGCGGCSSSGDDETRVNGDNKLEKNTNASSIVQQEKEKREKARLDSQKKKEKDKEDREKQKQLKEEKKEKRKTQKGERRR